MGNRVEKRKLLHHLVWMVCFVFMLGVSVTAKAATVMEAKQFSPATDFEFDMATGLITKYNGAAEEVVIPDKINGIDVKGLSAAFQGNTTVKTVIVPVSITTIGDDTFNGCTAFSNLAVYENGTVIPLETVIEEADLKNYVYDVNNAAGYVVLNANYGEATIPAKVEVLGRQAFGGKNGIAKFIVMPENAFYSTTEDGICLLSDGGKNLYRFASGYTCNNGYTLPEGLESIGSYAFEDIHNDGSLIFPSSLQVISDYGFYRYGMIDNNFVFPENSMLHTIGSYAFTYNRKMQIKLPKSLKNIGSYVFSYNENVAIDISETQIEVIPAYAFAQCSALHELTLPATVKRIEAYAFTECNNLSTVTFLGDTLESIGEGAFKDSPTLHYITIPDGVTAIENDTFSGCGNLGEVVLPDSVTTIGDNAFKDCVTIHTLVIPPNVEYISNTSFDGVDQTNIDTSKNEYAQTVVKGELPAKGTKKTIGSIRYKVIKSHETNGTVTVVKAKNKKQKNIEIPSTVNINGYTFKVVSIETKAFYNNKKLKKVTIGTEVTTIGKLAFGNCKQLKTITVKSKKVKSVKSNAFKNIHNNATIKLPKMSNKKFNTYKKKFMNKGQAKTVKIKK